MAADRPYFDMTNEEKQQWINDEYQKLLVVHEDGIEFAGKTASMIAYERMLESGKPPDTRLFNDQLAQHFAEPYGKHVSEVCGLALQHIFDPDGETGLQQEGHVNFTPARTQFINDYLTSWIGGVEGDKQVVEIGAGYTTRPFWVESLSGVADYFEVDTAPINKFKSRVLAELESKSLLTTPFCRRLTVDIDFLKSSVNELLHHGFSDAIPTCWILEGIVMYLGEEKSSSLLVEISDISVVGSFMILHFMVGNPASDPNTIEKLLQDKGWETKERIFFGDEKLNYGRYPAGKPANKFVGFSILQKVPQHHSPGEITF